MTRGGGGLLSFDCSVHEILRIFGPTRARDQMKAQRIAGRARVRPCRTLVKRLVMSPIGSGARRLRRLGVQRPAKRRPARKVRIEVQVNMTSINLSIKI
jgi:hypothetical protein